MRDRTRLLNTRVDYYSLVSVNTQWDYYHDTGRLMLHAINAGDGTWASVVECGAILRDYPVGILGSDKLHSSADLIRRFTL